jgi:anti-anti-sigma factor
VTIEVGLIFVQPGRRAKLVDEIAAIPATPDLSRPIRVRAREDLIVFSAHGDWDLSTLEEVQTQFDVAIAGAWPVVVVDFMALDFIDVVGARPLWQLITQCHRRGKEVLLVQASAKVAHALASMGFNEHLYGTED